MRFCDRTARPCGGMCRVKDRRPHQIATLFGMVTLRLPRFLCDSCGRGEPGVAWPSYCRSTPERDQLQAHLSALMPYRVAAGVLMHLLPVQAGKSPETFRGHTLKIGEQLRDAAAVEPVAATAAITVTLDSALYEALVCQALFQCSGCLSTSIEPRGSPPWCAGVSRYDLVFGWIRDGSTP
jgi:hypothetical protein